MPSHKKILIVSRAFYPQNRPRAFRTTELALEFAKSGHEVTVLTHKSSEHAAFEKEHNLKVVDLGTMSWPNIPTSGKSVFGLLGRAIAKLLYWLLEYPQIQLSLLVVSSLRGRKGYDLLISIAQPYPIHWGVAWAWKKNGKIARYWIADCGDPFMGRVNSDLKPPFYFKWVEKWFMKKPDYITVPTKGSIAGYYHEFHHKIKVIPQGFNFDSIKLPPFVKKEGAKVIFGYAGGFIPGKRDPTEFLQFLNQLDEKLNFEFHLYVKNAPFIMPFVKNSKGRIQVKDSLPRHELLVELSKMDFLVNFENVGSTETPSKLIDYAFINKPVLSVTYKSLDKNTVVAFLDGNFSNKRELPNLDDYRIEKIAENFLSLTETQVN